MSDERTVETIHREYSDLCAKAGHFQYTIVTVQKDLDLVNEQLRALNLEAAALKAKEGSNE